MNRKRAAIMNYKKIAETAHVSVSTVSKAFSESDDINGETKERIFSAAKELGCFDKYYKNKFSKKVIAVVCPEFGSPHYGVFAENIRKIVSERGDVAVFSSSNFDTSLESYLIDYYAIYAKADGIFLIDNGNRLLPKHTVPIVTAGLSNVDYVWCDLNEGMNKAISYLRNFGHTDICFIGERLTVSKETIFSKAVGKNGALLIRSDKRFEEAGFDCAEQFLCLENKPTAVIAAYDDIAIGFMNRLKQSGFSVPGDVSVIGIDNIPRSKNLATPLTSIDLSIDVRVSKALDILYYKIEHPSAEIIENISYPSELVCRQTVAPPKTV